MTLRGHAGRRFAWILAPSLSLACATAPTPAPAPAPARPPPAVTLADGESEAMAPANAALEPDVLELLTAHRREPPEEADAKAPDNDRATTRCHPERPDTPREQSLCICEEACTQTIDRQRLARRMLESGGDPETIQRWLDERRGSTLHYPYVEIDGKRIEFDGDGVVTRCRHFFGGVPDSRVDVQCAELPRTAPEPAP